MKKLIIIFEETVDIRKAQKSILNVFHLLPIDIKQQLFDIKWEE